VARASVAAASPADAALDRVRAICLAFPGTEEKLSHGSPSFLVTKGRMFLSFVDDHHADGRLAVWLKSTHEEQRRHVAMDPGRFFVPPYVGVGGWLGVRLDQPNTDWIELAMLVEEGWRAVAPKRLLEQGAGAVPRRAPPSPPRYPKTDERVARESLERLTKICLALPEADRERESRHASFRVKKKIFAYFLDNHHGDGIVAACFKGDKRANAALVEKEPKRFFSPPYIGARGWIGVRLDARRVDWKDVAKRAAASYRAVAPKKLAALVG
jgi:hypothetical protein